jgi:hypothetical protein
MALLLGSAATACILVLNSRERAVSVSKVLILSHIRSIAAGESEAAITNYAAPFLTGLRGGARGWQDSLARIRGLRRCDELEAYAGADWHNGKLGWLVRLRYHTAYSNDPPQLMYREDFMVRVPILGSRPEITHHGFD